jgi:spore germination protein GerM
MKNKIIIILIIVLVLVIAGLIYFVFLSPERFLTIKVFFNNNRLDPEFSCNKVSPAERKILKTQAVARAALEELLNGPTEKEKSEGYFTSINTGVEIQKLTIENGVAKVDFNEALEFQVGGSCRVAAIRAQITQTLKQFPTVNDVIISIDGRIEDILQP